MVPSVTGTVRGLLERGPRELLWRVALALPAWVTATCVLIGYHRAAPQRPPRPWTRHAVPAAVLASAW